MAKPVNNPRIEDRKAADALLGILLEVGFSRSQVSQTWPDRGVDVIVEAASHQAKFRFGVAARTRITPQTALTVCQELGKLPADMIRVLYAPVISDRVAEIARQEGVGTIDGAGNFRLVNQDPPLFLERRGCKSERLPTAPAVDLFATKSSRIVRAMLSRPLEGWQVRQLAEHPDVQVSPGLVVKVKRALVEEGYAIDHLRRLYLRDGVGLLNAWADRYSGPMKQIALYVRGDAQKAEETISRWCESRKLRYALAGFSAAWRLAPEVRYLVAAAYVEDRGFAPELLQEMARDYGAKQVESGATLTLWRPFDASVFADSEPNHADSPPVTSPLQTYLDLRRTAGRGEDAAKAVYDKYLLPDLQAAAERAKEWLHAAV